MKVFKVSVPLLSLCLLISCGRDSSESKSSAAGDVLPSTEEEVNIQNEVIAADGSNISGFYSGELIPLNYNLHFKTVGMVGVQREGDEFTAFVKMDVGPKSMVHKQAIYTGRRCPNLKDDLNKDAYIDIKEARVAMEQISIPLDADLDSQEAGIYQYPSGDALGKYFYKQTASFERMFADLKIPDSNPQDNVMKLPPDGGLTFPGRVIVIQGIAESALLPPTIAVEGDESPHKSLPVACAVLWKVPEVPPEFRTEEVSRN